MDGTAQLAADSITGVAGHCSDFPSGYETAPHRHARCQFSYASAGVMMVTSDRGVWVVPPDRALWVPAGMVHDVRMVSRVSTMTVWIDQAPALRMPNRCQVFNVSPLMRQLLEETVNFTAGAYAEARGRLITALLLNELEVLPRLPFRLPFPKNSKLATLCQNFLRNPTPHETIDDWSAALHVSRRTFTRLFRQETGLSFSNWRQHACLLAALPRLAAGESITSIAIDVGYNSPAAFATMFKRLQGVPPSRCLS
jgi:AraC-like DNA-binding protein